MPLIPTVWREPPTEAQAMLVFLASGILLQEYTLVRLRSLDPPWARKAEKGDMHKVTSEAGEIRNFSSLEWRPSTGDKDAGQQIPISHTWPHQQCAAAGGRTRLRKWKKQMKECIPQLCLWSSSLMSPQSLSPSQIQDEAMHLPSSHRNWSVLQVRTCGAAQTSCDTQRHTKQNTHITTGPPKQRVNCIFKMI